MNTWAQASPLKEAYPFSGLSGFNRSDYDAWIGNMECPTDPNVQPTTHEEEELLMFNCPATYLPELAKWFNIVSLANNHTDNHGLNCSFSNTGTELLGQLQRSKPYEACAGDLDSLGKSMYL